MSRLIFYDEGHEYQVDGEKVPSVSEILRFISREVYGDVAQYTLDNAADRGTRIHKACELLDKYGKVECDEDIAPYVKGYLRYLRDNKPQWTMIECAMLHNELRYAGTVDRFGTIDGSTVLADIKSSSVIQTRLVTPQLAAYAMLLPEKPERLLVIHLVKDGTYKTRDIPFDDSAFMACLTLHRLFAKKGRKTKSERN